MTIAVRSFAKINVGLYIGARRADGFHDLRTVYQTIALHDAIKVSVAPGSGIEIVCKCTDPRVPLDSSNTCYRMARLVMEAFGAEGKITVEIEKKLPVQGGLGAASSNAVATMLALEEALTSAEKRGRRRGKLRLYHDGLTGADRLRLAAQVGSDLPLFLVGGTVLGVGRGEEVYPLPDLPAIPMVVVTPEIGVSTAKAFAEWDELVRAEENHQPQRAQRGTEGMQGPAQGSTEAQGPLRQAEGRRSTSRTHTLASASASVGMTGLNDLTGEARRSTINAGCAGMPVSTRARDTRANDTRASELTQLNASDRLFEVGCALSAWLRGNSHAGAPAKAGGRAGSLLSDLVRAGIENDFETVVFSQFPELRDIKRALTRAGSRYASLSGSGSTVYGLFESPSDALKATKSLEKQGLKAVATGTLTRREYWKSLVVGR